eukprot:scaffold1044_cov192-Skeletonema_marinoi.AAC.11
MTDEGYLGLPPACRDLYIKLATESPLSIKASYHRNRLYRPQCLIGQSSWLGSGCVLTRCFIPKGSAVSHATIGISSRYSPLFMRQ